MIQINKRPKYKTHTPITFAVPAKQKKIIREIPHQSLSRMKENKADATDWYNLTFRMYVCYMLSIECYTTETQQAIVEVLDTLLNIKDKRSDDQTWLASQEQLEVIEAGLEAADQMDDQTTRRSQLEACHKAKAFLKQFL